MGAKQKLNAQYALGAVGAAALLGGVTGSWGVFVAAALVILSASVVSGDIRR